MIFTWQVITALTASVILWLFLLRWLGFFNWVRPSFEGDDGKASFKRLVPFNLMILASYMIFYDKIPMDGRMLAFWGCLITALLYAGVVTVAQVLAFKNGGKVEDNPKDIKDGDTVTVNKTEQ